MPRKRTTYSLKWWFDGDEIRKKIIKERTHPLEMALSIWGYTMV